MNVVDRNVAYTSSLKMRCSHFATTGTRVVCQSIHTCSLSAYSTASTMAGGRSEGDGNEFKRTLYTLQLPKLIV